MGSLGFENNVKIEGEICGSRKGMRVVGVTEVMGENKIKAFFLDMYEVAP